MKTCSRCHQSLPETAFSRIGKRLHSWCTDCQKGYKDQHYRDNKVVYLEKVREQRLRLRAEIDEIKNRPCMDCGESYPSYVMDFDHRDGEDKAANVSRLVRNNQRGRALKEVAKCDIVCANCHRARTYQRQLAQSSNGQDVTLSM